MGYTTTSIEEAGFNLAGGDFVTVGDSDNVDIQSIIPQFPDPSEIYDDEPKDGAFSIQEVYADGSASITYFWMLEGSTAPGVTGAGWYTLENNVYTKATRVFEKGEGFFLSVPYFENEDGDPLASSFTDSGEVQMGAKTMGYDESTAGFFLRSNYRPVEMSIQKLVPTFPNPEEIYDDEPKDGAFSIQEVYVDGSTSITYFWMLEGSTAPGVDGAGWYTLENNVYTKATKMFAPGEGFFFCAPYYENEDGDPLGGTLQFTE